MKDGYINALNRKSKIAILVLIDFAIVALSYWLSIELTYKLKNVDVMTIGEVTGLAILVYIITLWSFKLYKGIWTNAGTYEFINCTKACVVAGIINCILIKIFYSNVSMLSVFLAATLIFILCNGARMSLRIFNKIMLDRNYNNTRNDKKTNVLIIGAGTCATTIIGEIKREKSNDYKIIGIIDDDKNKHHTLLDGIEVLGGREKIEEIAKEKNVKEVFLAIAKIGAKDKGEIIDICSNTKAKMKIIPGIYELLDGKVSVNKMRDVDLKDLLGREEIELDKEGIQAYIEGKTILVTGGGGSIGSELCRQIAVFNPKKLLILDIYENNAYDLENELARSYPELDKEVIIASVRDKQRLNQVFAQFSPNIVFHAAAHKHVPLMERNPGEAVKNNVLGTLNVVKCASQHKIEKFVMISTDKAVNPTNVMGATKRICEMIVQAMNNEKNNVTEFVAVRFGNVRGSNGSVIPLFNKQIKEGGPLTLTHKDIIRYFMLIPEAAQLVLQAGAYAKGGEIFILDMGKPVRIYDLAEKLIQLSGFTPHNDIEIKITGLRPGEKLYEELLINKENNDFDSTEHEKIFIDKPSDKINWKEVMNKIDKLIFMSKTGNPQVLVEKLKEIVPTYSSPEEVNNIYKEEIAATVPESVGGKENGNS